MSDVIALVTADEHRIYEGGVYDSDDPRVQRNPQWFAEKGEEIIDREFTVKEVKKPRKR